MLFYLTIHFKKESFHFCLILDNGPLSSNMLIRKDETTIMLSREQKSAIYTIFWGIFILVLAYAYFSIGSDLDEGARLSMGSGRKRAAGVLTMLLVGTIHEFLGTWGGVALISLIGLGVIGYGTKSFSTAQPDQAGDKDEDDEDDILGKLQSTFMNAKEEYTKRKDQEK